jgi:hypothetical protein
VHFFWLLFFVQAKKSDPRAGRARKNERTRSEQNQEQTQNWIPAFAGMTSERAKTLDSGFRRDDEPSTTGT